MEVRGEGGGGGSLTCKGLSRASVICMPACNVQYGSRMCGTWINALGASLSMSYDLNTLTYFPARRRPILSSTSSGSSTCKTALVERHVKYVQCARDVVNNIHTTNIATLV